MTYKLVVSNEAHNDTDEIVRYIALELCNPGAAAGFLDDVERCYHVVVDNPCMYSLCNDAKLSMDGYRKVVVKNYLIIYRVDEDKKTVFIVRIIYGSRNYIDII